MSTNRPPDDPAPTWGRPVRDELDGSYRYPNDDRYPGDAADLAGMEEARRDLTDASPQQRAAAEESCSIPEAHAEHMRINGDCPWCGAYDEAMWS